MMTNEIEKAKAVLENSEALPFRCYGYRLDDPDAVTLVERGMHGYSPYMTTGGRDAAIRMNAEVGVTVQQMEAMVAGSMFGFHAPAANPAIYNADGKVCRTKFSRLKARKG